MYLRTLYHDSGAYIAQQRENSGTFIHPISAKNKFRPAAASDRPEVAGARTPQNPQNPDMKHTRK